MKKRVIALFLLALSICIPALSQTQAGVNGYCSLGGKQAAVSGIQSTNYLNGVVIGCQITPYLTGTTTLAPYSLTAGGTIQTGPFTANSYGSLNPSAFLFFATQGVGIDVVASGGIPPNNYAQPITILTDLIPGGGGGGGGGTVCGAGTATFIPIWQAGNCIGNSPMFTDVTGVAALTIPFPTVNVIANQTNFFGASGVAGSISLLQGTHDAPSPNEVEIEAPTSVPTAYVIHPPSAQGAGCWDNDGSGNSTWLANCGSSSLQPAITPPVSGQSIILYPTIATPTSSGCSGAEGFANGTSASGTFGAGGCNIGLRTASVLFNGYSLPAGITAGSVTAIYASVISSYIQTGSVLSSVITAGLSPYTGSSLVNTNTPFPLGQLNVLTGLAGTDIPNIGILGAGSGSTCADPGCGAAFAFSATTTMTSPVLVVYYTGSPVTIPAPINVQPPLMYQADGNLLGIDPSAEFPGLGSVGVTASVAKPIAYQYPTMAVYVTDGTAGTCTGGGTQGIWCVYSASGGGTLVPAIFPTLTTKGDLLGFSTVPARIPVGSDTQVLTADSTQPLGVKWASAGASTDPGFGTLAVDVETAYSGANAGAKLIACLADGTLAPGTICDMRGILNEVTQPVSLGTAPIEVGRSGPQSVLWPSCIGPTNSFCGAVLNTASTTLATPSAPTIACSTTGGGYHSAGVTVFAKVNYRTGDAVSASSSEVSCTLASTTTGMITVTGPASCPTYTSEYDVSLSLTTGAETKQMNAACGSTAVFTSQDLFPVSTAAPSSATPLPAIIIHNNKSEFYALHSGQNGFPFYTSGSTVATDMLATTDNGYSGISNIFLYNNGGGTVTYGMADNGVYKSSIRDNINISAGSVGGLHLFGQYNDVTWNIPQFGCSSNSCTPLVIEWSPQTVGDGESLNTIGFDGMLISTKANASNTGSGIKITGRSGAGSTFWSSVGSGVGGINITNSSLEMGAAAVNGIMATDFNNLNFSGSKITRASFGGTAAININQTYHQSGQAYQSGPVSINNTSHIDGFTDVVLNNVSTDTAMTIAATSGVSFDNNYYWGGGTNSLASPPYSDVKGDVPVYLGDASPFSVNNANCRGTCTGFGTGGVPAITNTSSTTPVGIHNTTPLDSLDIAGFMNDMTGAVAVATLNGNCSNVATSCSITVSSGTIPASGYVEFIDGTAEIASFSAGTSTALGGLTRGIWNTSGNSHNNGNNVWIIPWAVSSTNSLPPYIWVTGQGGVKVDSGPSTNDNNSANTIQVENFWATFGGFCFGNSYSGPCMNSDGSNGFKFVDSSGNIVWAADSTGATAVKEANLAVTSGTTTLTSTAGIANLTGTAPTAVATITPLASCTETGVGCFQHFTGVGATLVTGGNIAAGGTFAANTEWGCTYNQAATKWSCFGASAGSIPSQYKTQSCQSGVGDGLNVITSGTYPQTPCKNVTGVTWTITSIQCFTDNNGTSTMDVKNHAGTSLLTGPITCSNSFAAGTQSGTTTLVNNDTLNFTFVADGTSKQVTFLVGWTY